MAKVKQQGGPKKTMAPYLRFEEGKEKELKVSDWSFGRGIGGYLFKCYVVEEDGEPVDKIWTVWDYDSTQILKKKLGTKYVTGTKALKVTMHKNEEEDTYFEFA
jgi:hypothetical protein